MPLEMKVYNVDIKSHLASFKLLGVDAFIIDLNVNTQLEYSENNSHIIVPGSVLTSGVDAESESVINTVALIPNISDHTNPDVATLAQAKTE